MNKEMHKQIRIFEGSFDRKVRKYTYTMNVMNKPIKDKMQPIQVMIFNDKGLLPVW